MKETVNMENNLSLKIEETHNDLNNAKKTIKEEIQKNFSFCENGMSKLKEDISLLEKKLGEFISKQHVNAD